MRRLTYSLIYLFTLYIFEKSLASLLHCSELPEALAFIIQHSSHCSLHKAVEGAGGTYEDALAEEGGA